MTKRTLDPATLSKLGDLTDHFEICDPNGRRVGFFFPVTRRDTYSEEDPPVGEEELQRREREDKRYTTQEVLDRLRNA